MTPPSDRESILCAMFESFCVTTIHNFGRNLKRARKNRRKHDGTGEEPVEYLIDQLSNEDVYAVEQLILNVDGLPPCSVESELLYNALLWRRIWHVLCVRPQWRVLYLSHPGTDENLWQTFQKS